jgi:pimeloyl-ACP methyl ester carboxylesterase
VGAPTRRQPPARLPMSFAVVIALAAACAPDDASIDRTALEGSSPVVFRTADGVKLAGRVFGPEDAAAGVVMAHGLSLDQSSWFTFADRLGDAGYRALTFNFRGYCPGDERGCSGGDKDVGSTPQDLSAAVREVRSDGARRVAILGSSMGGTAALVASSALGDRIEALVALSAPTQIEDLAAGPDVLQAVTAAKLFLAGTGDGTAALAAEAFFEQSLQPKRYELLTTDDHGVAMLEGNQGEASRNLVLDWLSQYLPIEEPTAAAG